MVEEFERSDGAPIEVHLKDYLRVVRKHAGIASAFFLVVVAAVAVVTFRTPEVFRATTTLSIERQGPQTYALEDLISQESPQDEYRKTQQELILSRPIVHAVYGKLDLENHELFKDREKGEDIFRESIQVSPREGTYLVDVSIESRDRAKVAQWVNALAEEYVRYVDLRYRTTSREAEDRINKRIPELRGKLLESEKALADFLKENNVVSFEKQLEILYRKLNTLESRLTSVETERIRLNAGYRVLVESQNGKSFPAHLPEVATSDALRALMRQEAVLIESFARVKAKYKPKHVKYLFSREQLTGVQEKIREEVQRISEDLKAQLDAKEREKVDLSSLITEERKTIGRLEAQSNKVKSLQQEVESNRRMYQDFTERRKEIESASNLGRTEVDIVERSRTPTEAVRPKKWLNLTLAAVVGILGGIALAFFIEYLDDSFKTPEEAEALDAPLLGIVQDIGKGIEEGDRDLVCLKHPKAPPAEAFRAIRTGLTFTQAAGEERRSYLVTSSGPVEGKTLNAVNIALTMARADKKILLVDADMRKPALHKVLGLPAKPGLSSYFVDEADFDTILQEGPISNLHFISAGAIPPNPSELLGSPRLEDFLKTALS
ncbi:MAG: GumC family protein, partial [Planctomycetota bacterium]